MRVRIPSGHVVTNQAIDGEDNDNTCPIDRSPNKICGGPHRAVFTDIGWEILAPSEQSIGNAIVPTGEQIERFQQALRQARGRAPEDYPDED